MSKKPDEKELDSYFYVGLTFFLLSLAFLGASFGGNISPVIGTPFLMLGIVFMTWSSSKKKKK